MYMYMYAVPRPGRERLRGAGSEHDEDVGEHRAGADRQHLLAGARRQLHREEDAYGI